MELIDALGILRKRSQQAKAFKVFLACSFTPLHLKTFLAAHLQTFLPERCVEVTTGPYGSLQASLARMNASDCEAAVVVIEWSDFDPRLGIRQLGGWGPAELADILKEAPRRAQQLQGALIDESSKVPIVLSFPTLPLPPVAFTPPWQASNFDLQLHQITFELARWSSEQPNIRVAKSEYLRPDHLPTQRFDVQSEVLTNFPYTVKFASILGETLARLVRNTPPKKGIITDLDDTLWGGVLGDVGVDGISWDSDHHTHMHGLYQQVLQALAQEGVLVAIASKNDSSLVEKVFQSRALMLSKKKVFPLEVHWGPKSESVTRVLKTWNIGAEDAVFVDDSPMELAEVKTMHPKLECIKFPKEDYRATYELIQHFRVLFGKSALSAEDGLRLDSLRNARRFSLDPADGTSMDHFLGQAQAELSVSLAKSLGDSRILELINKTNQFNLNGKRFSEMELRAYLRDSNSLLLTAAYTDKYGPLGKITVLVGKTHGPRLVIDAWVMSCRAFSRRIEYACLAYLFKELSVREIVFNFVRTERNGPLVDFLAQFCDLNSHGDVGVEADTFASKCPALSHAIKELPHG